MNILFLTHDVPNPKLSTDSRPFYLIRTFNESYNYNLFIFSFFTKEKEEFIPEIKKYCEKTLFVPFSTDNQKNIIRCTLINFLSPRSLYSKLKSKNGTIDFSYFNKISIQEMVDDFIEEHNIDIIYTDSGMAGYVANSKISKIVEPLDINYVTWFKNSFKEKNISKKIYLFIRSLQTFMREILIYRRFDYCVLITKNDQEYINRFISNTSVIPNGVDTDYFSPFNKKVNGLSIIFTGMMSGKKNIESVLFFYKEIYPKVKEVWKGSKFYVVGSNPSKILFENINDPSVIITGFVEDIRPFLDEAQIFVCPMISGTGLKNKVLEAMAMAKPIVSTSIGIMGINCESGRDVMVCDDTVEFSNVIIDLFEDEVLRSEIGTNARELVKNNYSWITCTHQLNDLFKRLYNEKN